ncbi:hypothetical protein NDU88_000760 [Pleurodeles waltl]|uniref:Uncharacterized protein n=1 Tax=Pleurodeles waltl TaxID=8319 RepID=A0AAV7R9N2_PLEWA|nr:hypothetical protein NDU88_000760 [Pleurodeles waltl]
MPDPLQPHQLQPRGPATPRASTPAATEQGTGHAWLTQETKITAAEKGTVGETRGSGHERTAGGGSRRRTSQRFHRTQAPPWSG